MALDWCQNFVSTQYVENELMGFAKFCICIDIDNIYVEIVTH